MAEFYEFIRIYGLPESAGEEFQGLGAAAMYNAADAQPFSGGQDVPDTSGSGSGSGSGGDTETPEEFSATLWEAQAGVITQQSAFITKIQEDFKKKYDETPTMDEITQTTFIEEFIEWLAGRVVAYFWGPTAGQIAEFSVALACLAIKLLNVLLQESIEICDALVKENNELLTLATSRENYLLRSQIISQHDNSIANILASIATTEDQLIQSRQLDEMIRRNEIANFELYEDNIVMLNRNKVLYTKSLVEETN